MESTHKLQVTSLLEPFSLTPTVDIPIGNRNNPNMAIDNTFIDLSWQNYFIKPVVNGILDNGAQII